MKPGPYGVPALCLVTKCNACFKQLAAWRTSGRAMSFIAFPVLPHRGSIQNGTTAGTFEISPPKAQPPTAGLSARGYSPVLNASQGSSRHISPLKRLSSAQFRGVWGCYSNRRRMRTTGPVFRKAWGQPFAVVEIGERPWRVVRSWSLSPAGR